MSTSRCRSRVTHAAGQRLSRVTRPVSRSRLGRRRGRRRGDASLHVLQVDERHVSNFVVGEMTEDDGPVRLRGDGCLREFFAWLDTLTENGTRPLTVLTHNFQGYDSYPVIDELHRQKRQLEQMRNGGKVLQNTTIDSLSFFRMPLSAFPKTFGLTELKRG